MMPDQENDGADSNQRNDYFQNQAEFCFDLQIMQHQDRHDEADTQNRKEREGESCCAHESFDHLLIFILFCGAAHILFYFILHLSCKSREIFHLVKEEFQ